VGVEYFKALPAERRPRPAPMLAAAMERKYSGNPGEGFFTGGGLHTSATSASSIIRRS
jgi:hypothetical protein